MSGNGLQTPNNAYGYPLPIFGLGASQNISFNGSAGIAVVSKTFSDSCQAVLLTLAAGNDARIAIGLAPEADENSTLIPSPAMVVLLVPRNGLISILSNVVTGGNVCLTELASRASGFV